MGMPPWVTIILILPPAHVFATAEDAVPGFVIVMIPFIVSPISKADPMPPSEILRSGSPRGLKVA
jgi:hypothetical protein